MTTSDYPNMEASQSLLPETTRSEGGYGEVKKKLDELQRRFKLQELQELAAFEDELKAIDAEFEKQRGDIAASNALLDSSLRETFERLLRDKRDSRAQRVHTTYQAKKDERKKRYDDDKQKYKQEAFAAITALMNAEPGLSPFIQPPPPTPKLAETAPEILQTTAASRQASPAKVEPVVPSQPCEVASPLTAQVVSEDDKPLSEDDRPPSPSRVGISGDALATPSQSVTEHGQVSPAESSQQTRIGESEVIDLASPARSEPAEPSAPSEAAVGQEPETSVQEPTISVGVYNPPYVAADPVSDSDSVLKRKANGESNGDSSTPARIRVKRAKLDKTHNGADSIAVDDSLASSDGQEAARRTVTFNEVYGTPPQRDENGKLKLGPGYRHIIVQYPCGNGGFYILRCDGHGVHFGEHPLRGAAKHLASAQHGHMSKAHATAIATLGHLVVDCTQELAEKNNAAVIEAFKEGGYKPFNANNLSQTRRAELGFPPLDSPSAQTAAAHRMGAHGGSQQGPSSTSPARFRKQFAGVVDPISCKFYLACRGELKIPVLILPWGDVSPAGIGGTLADTGLLGDFTDDGKPLGIPKLPKCYIYDQVGGRISGIRGWASGYESGPLVRKREFPVVCVDGPDYRSWGIGWIDAANLSVLDFNDPNSQKIPFAREAWEYYVNKILPSQSADQGTGTSTPQQQEHDHPRGYISNSHTAPPEDVEMRDVEAEYNDANSRRDLLSEPNPRELAAIKSSAFDAPPMSPVTNARMIAAQALGLPAPARNGFTAVNSAPPTEIGVSRSASESLEPPSRAASVSSTGAGHRRVVKIHAHSNNPHHTNQGQASPSIVLPERPVDGMPPRVGPGIQPIIVRKPSPASLQNILQNFTSEGFGSPQRAQSPKPQTPQYPPPSMATHTTASLPPLSLFATINAQPPRESRAESAPVLKKDTLEEEKPRAGSASAAPGPATQNTSSTSPPPTPESQEQPPPPPPQTITIPPLSTTLQKSLPQLSISPLTTPTASALNTRANSPILIQSKPGTPSVSFIKPEAPTGGPILPTMDVFDLGGFMEGDTEVFATKEPGHFLRLIDDHESGVFRTADDASVSVAVEPRGVRLVERMPTPTGAVCIVKLTYYAVDGAEEGEGRTQMLVFEKARSTVNGMMSGVVHARRFCRRLKSWNPNVVCPSPSVGSDSIDWRPTPSPQAPSPSPTPGLSAFNMNGRIAILPTRAGDTEGVDTA